MGQSVTVQGLAPGIKRLVGDTASIGAGRFFLALGSWFLLIIIARAGGPEGLGLYTLALAIATPIFQFASMGHRTVLASDAAYRRTTREFVRARTTTLALATILTMTLGWLLGILPMLVLAGVVLARIADRMSDISYGHSQREGSVRATGYSMVVRTVLATVAAAAVAYLSEGIAPPLIGWAAAFWVTFLVVDRNALRRPSSSSRTPRYQTSPTLAILRETLPLGVSALLVALMFYAPRFLVDRFLGTYELGVFAGVMGLLVAATLLTNAIGETMTPMLGSHAASDRTAAFWRLLVGGLAVAAAAGLIGIALAAAFGRTVVAALLGPEFADPGLIMAVAFISIVVLPVSLMPYAMTAARVFRAQMWVSMGGLVASIGFSSLLIPVWSTTGAVVAIGIVNVVVGIASVVAIMRSFRRFERFQR